MARKPKPSRYAAETVGHDLMEFFRGSFDQAVEKSDEHAAATGMMLVAIEAMLSWVGNEETANMLDAISTSVRNGQDITITLEQDHSHRH